MFFYEKVAPHAFDLINQYKALKKATKVNFYTVFSNKRDFLFLTAIKKRRRGFEPRRRCTFLTFRILVKINAARRFYCVAAC